MSGQWYDTLPKPIAFAFSGGASLGAIQVGMLRALHTAGICPDLLLGTSVGALNAAVLADRGFTAGLEMLEALWGRVQRSDIFDGTAFDQLLCLLQTGHSLFRHDRLSKLIGEMLHAHTFAELHLPLGVIATEIRNRRRTLFTTGNLRPALLASSAIPGIFPSVQINRRCYVDGCFSANVPLTAALDMGAASLIVFHTGNRRTSSHAPRRLTDRLLSTVAKALHQQALREAPLVAQQIPLVYLPAPTLPPHGLFEFGGNWELMNKTSAHVAHFLATATPPAPGAMCGTLHFQAYPPAAVSQRAAHSLEPTTSALAMA